MEFAKRLDFHRLSVVFCTDMAGVAKLYINMLKKNGFETISAGNLHGECEPVTLAALCNDRRTDLNVLDGRVVGECMAKHRHQEFLRFLWQLDREFLMDQYRQSFG